MCGSVFLCLFLKHAEADPPTKAGLAHYGWERLIQGLLICQTGTDFSKNTEQLGS